MKIYITTLYIVLFSSFTFAQQNNEDSIQSKIKRFSIGIKGGVPNGLSGTLEITPPLFASHFALYVDVGNLNIKLENEDINLKYNEYGINYYFGKEAKGIYVSAGVSKLNTNLIYTGLEVTAPENITYSGSARIEEQISSKNIKLGVKTGGRIFFRLELGYGFSNNIPNTLTIMASANTPSGMINETETVDFPEVIGIGEKGLFVGNIGFGISLL